MGWTDIVSSVAKVGGAVIGMIGDKKKSDAAQDYADKQGDATLEAAQVNKELSLYDASIAEKEATEAFLQYNRNIILHNRMSTQLMGKQRTTYAKSGVIPGTGTPMDVQIRTGQELAEDAAVIKYEGQKAVERRRGIAQRYRLLAEKGLRDAGNTASLLHDTADWESMGFKYDSYSRGINLFADWMEG